MKEFNVCMTSSLLSEFIGLMYPLLPTILGMIYDIISILNATSELSVQCENWTFILRFAKDYI